MKFKLTTLVDITETNIRKGPDKIAIGQQSNYDTLIQVIGLRANPNPIQVAQHNGSIANIGFGSSFKGKQNYWEFVFEMPDGSASIDNFKSDFHLVPFVTELTETAKINISVFNTQDSSSTNIVFEEIE
jgi:hypothetical protein